MMESAPESVPTTSWKIGDICVCQWSDDKEWYYAEIIDIDETAQTCTVSFLFYENEESDVALTGLFRYDAPEAR